MKFSKIFFILLILFILLCAGDGMAQCAMCKANAESNFKSGGTIAKGLNTGILYLMAIPYLILGTLFFLFFKKQILQKLRAFKHKFQSV